MNNESIINKEVDRWLGSAEWELAGKLHDLLCTRGHQMDQCWGLVLPYDLNQPELSSIQRHYLGMARVFMESFDMEQVNLFLTVIESDWQPENFPLFPMEVA